ncbi:aspartate ammonia-lyase [Pseudolabrys sp.]|uniref:aspartate ammonia-lyase n=1 Tax=Pseudolabrys sp. TaxID=1960880 RepID=UPI003D0FF89E
MTQSQARVETDTFGPRQIPSAAFYGSQTDRARENFDISGRTLREWPVLIASFGYVKEACAHANFSCGKLAEGKYIAIKAACEAIRLGRYDGEFVVDVFQGGAGTSTNMNVNEVIANVALDILGLPRGRYDVIHPIDHVNMSQSTNDSYPTAARLAVYALDRELTAALRSLVASFQVKAEQFSAIPKLGRTQLQDAVPMTLGQEFSAFATTLNEDLNKLSVISRNFAEVGLGGTAIGTGLNAPEGYSDAAIAYLSEITAIPFSRSENLIEATWDMGAFVLYSGMLKRTASKLSKISNDLRLLASGPTGGFGEIRLPARQPGSSIMPSKVNPVIPEVVNQVAFHVIGNDVAITIAAEAGQLQLNAMMPVIVLKTFESVRYLTRAIVALETLCVRGIEADAAACARPLTTGVAKATALVPQIGYEAAARVAKLIDAGQTLEAALQAAMPKSQPENSGAPAVD